MYKSGSKPVGFWSAVSLGIGSMIGAGIFALLGEAGTLAGNAVYLSFLAGGVIALFSGYSLGRLGARYPSSGGIVEYLTQSYGIGTFTGGMSVMMYIAALVALSMIAKTFGNYAASMLPDGSSPYWPGVFAVSVVVLFVLVNLRGARDIAVWERMTVGIKFTALIVLAVTGIWHVRPELLAASRHPPVSDIFYSLAITFFAYEGFRVITNAAEDMPNPAKTLPRAMMTAILLVAVLYVAVAIAVYGNLPADQVIKAKDYALAEAARPVFGNVGFVIVAVVAVISTASSINANLYAVTNVSYQLARYGELPGEFGKPVGHSREGLLISGMFVIVLSLFFDLTEIAVLGSLSILFVHTMTHIGHYRIIHETGASRPLVILAILSSGAAMLLSVYHQASHAPGLVLMLIGFMAAGFVTEVVLAKVTGKTLKNRTPEA